MWSITKRQVSSATASKILRPFYLQVHPDFFFNDEEKKSINENSLKELNRHLVDLESGSHVATKMVHFHSKFSKKSIATMKSLGNQFENSKNQSVFETAFFRRRRRNIR